MGGSCGLLTYGPNQASTRPEQLPARDVKLVFIMESLQAEGMPNPADNRLNVVQLASPHDNTSPPQSSQPLPHSDIPLFVLSLLSCPVRGILLRHSASEAAMKVPEAAMDKHNRSESWEDRVWAARQVPVPKGEAKASSMKSTSNQHFWSRVRRLYRAHDARPGKISGRTGSEP